MKINTKVGATVNLKSAPKIRGGERFEHEYMIILNHAIFNGYRLPSLSQQKLQNNLVFNLKASGIWSKLDVLYIFATNGSSDFAMIDWINPSTRQATLSGTPTFTANSGWLTNGTSNHINTNFSPASDNINLSQNSGSFFADNRLQLQQNSAQLFGSSSSNVNRVLNRLQLNPWRVNDGMRTYAVNDSSGDQGYGVGTALGFFHLERSNSTQKRIYRNGVLESTLAANSVSHPDFSIYIGAWNAGGTTIQQRQVINGIFGAGASLSGLESNLYDHWNNYFTSL